MKKTILLAGCCGTTLMFEKMIPGDDSYNYVIASTSDDAIELALAHDPDLVLLDDRLLGAGALETCRVIRERSPRAAVPIIIATGLSNRGIEEKSLGAGCTSLVSKPFIATELLTAVRQHVG